MRNAIVLTTVLFILVPAYVKAAEPIGWWKFEEKDGNTAKDSSGNGFDAAVILDGGPKIWSPGEGFDSNGCAKFTAQQTVVIPDAIWSKVKDQLTSHSGSTRMPPPRQTTNGPAHGESPQPRVFLIQTQTGSNCGRLCLRPEKAIDMGNDSENIYWMTTSAEDYAGKWNLYVFVKDANEYSLKMYHNGDKVAERYGAMEPIPKISNFMLGGRMYPTADWSGKIDDFRIYNKALSPDDILKMYMAKACQAKNRKRNN